MQQLNYHQTTGESPKQMLMRFLNPPYSFSLKAAQKLINSASSKKNWFFGVISEVMAKHYEYSRLRSDQNLGPPLASEILT